MNYVRLAFVVWRAHDAVSPSSDDLQLLLLLLLLLRLRLLTAVAKHSASSVGLQFSLFT